MEMDKAIKILQAIENNEYVSRWVIFQNRYQLRDILEKGDYSDELKESVEERIESARESL